MFLFKKEKTILGFDLSKKSVKVVELNHETEKPTLVTYGGLEISKKISTDIAINQEEILKTIDEVITRSKATTKNIVASLHPQHVFSSILTVPNVPDNELKEAIKWEAKNYIPAPLEEVILDWQKINRLPQEGKIEIYLIAAPKKTVNYYLDIYRKAGLNPLALEVDPLAILRTLPFEEQKKTLILIDFGAYETSITIIEKGILILCRTITLGGETLTKTISSSLNIDTARAEEFKKRFGIQPEKLEGQIIKSIQPIVNTLISEIKRSVDFYKKSGQETIEKIILSGGSAVLPGLVKYIQDSTNIETQLINPWANINYPTDIEKYVQEIGPSFATAIGLALRKI